VDTAESPSDFGPIVDPGDTLAASTPFGVALRETVVRRNLRSKRGPRRRLLAFVRCRDRALRVVATGDGLRIEGVAAGGSVAIGIDGLIYTVPTHGGETARAIARRLSLRLLGDHPTEIVEESTESSLLLLTSHT
jgi:hypothetical protein